MKKLPKPGTPITDLKCTECTKTQAEQKPAECSNSNCPYHKQQEVLPNA